ncbi:MAG: DNA gyrase inhibitor YacG [Phycisphaerae bacterium]
MPTFHCPTCGTSFTTPTNDEAPWRPFCSRRCKMVDLGKWFDGTYRISEPITPSEPDDPEAHSPDA